MTFASLALPAAALLSGGGHHGFRPTVEGFYIVDFLVYVGLLYYFLRRPVASFVSARRERIVSDMEEARRMRSEADARLREYNDRLEHLEDEIGKLLDDARSAGAAYREKLMADAQRGAERLRREAAARLQQESRHLATQLQSRAIELAMEVAEKVVAEQITDAHRRRFVGDYITDIEARQGEL